MTKIAIVGYGRFGKVLEKLLKDDFELTIVTQKNPNDIEQVDVVFYSVPISKFEQVLMNHKKYIKDDHLLIDVLSVKTYPSKIFKKILKGKKTEVILTHPMFGPDSTQNGFDGHKIVMDKFLSSEEKYLFWKNFFQSKNLEVVELNPTEHDKIAAHSQGITHFIGRLLEKMNFRNTPIDTLGAKKLQEIMQQTCNDSWELFLDLQNYNPYTESMRKKLEEAYKYIYKKILSHKFTNIKEVIFGIQGGKGSFNEEALMFYINQHNIKNYKIKYLYITKNVLKELNKRTIDYGIFAISNSVSGVVDESLEAILSFDFHIKDRITIPIRHFLMKRRDISFSDIKTIMAHPQVFGQCKNTLKTKYPNLAIQSGKREMIDTAKAAEALALGKLNKETAILGPKILSEIYNFDIVDLHLEDDPENKTTFLVVENS